MTLFYEKILKAISGYKFILRKNLSSNEYAQRVSKLGLKKKYVKVADDLVMYEIGLRIMKELVNIKKVGKGKRPGNFYSGTREFLEHLEELFSEYTLEGDTVVHVGQKSSCSLLIAIQLAATPKEKIDETVLSQIKYHSNIVFKYGNEEQKEILNDAIVCN